MTTNKNLLLWNIVFFAVLVWSGINPKDYFTWILEIFPALVAYIILAFTYKRFKFTTFSYILILIHASILFVGGHYTYEEVPLFNWIRDTFHQSRNNYDKLGHLAQGFIPAIITREVFIRLNIVLRKKWLFFIIVSVCLAASALYELFEWMMVMISGESADAFLGTQGYIWDTQTDMLCALIGSVLALVTLTKLHDKQLHKMITTKTQESLSP